MGFHQCEFCSPEDAGKFNHRNTSSSDIVMRFKVKANMSRAFGALADVMNSAEPKEVAFIMPQMVPHYLEHGWVPPKQFIDAVMNGELLGFDWHQTRGGGSGPIQVGYLSGSIPKEGSLLEGFAEKIWSYIQQAAAAAGYEA